MVAPSAVSHPLRGESRKLKPGPAAHRKATGSGVGAPWRNATSIGRAVVAATLRAAIRHRPEPHRPARHADLPPADRRNPRARRRTRAPHAPCVRSVRRQRTTTSRLAAPRPSRSSPDAVTGVAVAVPAATVRPLVLLWGFPLAAAAVRLSRRIRPAEAPTEPIGTCLRVGPAQRLSLSQTHRLTTGTPILGVLLHLTCGDKPVDHIRVAASRTQAHPNESGLI